MSLPPEVQAILDEIGSITAGSLQRKYFLCVSEGIGNPQDELPFIVEHLRKITEWEESGALFAAGPFLEDDGRPSADAIYIIRAKTESDARKILDEEPLLKQGMRKHTVRPWSLNQGRVGLSVSFSDKSGDVQD